MNESYALPAGSPCPVCSAPLFPLVITTYCKACDSKPAAPKYREEPDETWDYWQEYALCDANATRFVFAVGTGSRYCDVEIFGTGNNVTGTCYSSGSHAYTAMAARPLLIKYAGAIAPAAWSALWTVWCNGCDIADRNYGNMQGTATNPYGSAPPP